MSSIRWFRYLLMTPFLCSLLFFMSGGCTPATGPNPSTDTTPLWYGKIQPIIQQNCQNCHQQGGIGPFPLTNYEEVKAKASLVKWSVENRRMPPWMPSKTYTNDSKQEENCLELQHSLALSDDQIKDITAWVDGGTPMGDVSKKQEFAPKQDQLESVDADLGAQSAHTPDGKTPDDYHCFLTKQAIAPEAGDKELTGFQLIPGVREMVHHVLIYRVSGEFAKELGTQYPEKNWDCYTGALFDGKYKDKAGLLGVWVPGTDVIRFPQDTGISMKAGDHVMMEIHYNLNALDKPKADTTNIRLQFARKPVKHNLVLLAHAQTKMNVPAGEKNYLISDNTGKLTIPGALWGIMPHMHKYGKAFKTTISKSDGKNACLINIPTWDYSWQQTFFYKSPVLLDLGDDVKMDCYFDNPTDKPITWGDRTEDEMCLNFYFVSFTRP
ncbi:MAG: c-type cytochrome [Myxococcales bacterium]|nr:c-type cytochrome [Myxococcales bacterium]